MLSLSFPEAQGTHAVVVTARFPATTTATPSQAGRTPTSGAPASFLRLTSTAPRAGGFFPRTGYPAMLSAFSPTIRQAQGDKQHVTSHFVYPGVDPEKGELLKRVVLVGKKATTVDLPIAFNDPPGDYEVSVTELLTNKTVTKKLTIQ